MSLSECWKTYGPCTVKSSQPEPSNLYPPIQILNLKGGQLHLKHAGPVGLANGVPRYDHWIDEHYIDNPTYERVPG